MEGRMSDDTMCIILKTNRNGRTEYRVAVVQGAEKMYIDALDDNRIVNFFAYMGEHFGRMRHSDARVYITKRLEELGDATLNSTWAAQLLSHMLDTYGTLPVFYTESDALGEAERLSDEQDVEHGMAEINMTMSISRAPPTAVAA